LDFPLNLFEIYKENLRYKAINKINNIFFSIRENQIGPKFFLRDKNPCSFSFLFNSSQLMLQQQRKVSFENKI